MRNGRLGAAGCIHAFDGYMTAGRDAKHGRSLGKQQQKYDNGNNPVAAESSRCIPKAALESIFPSIRPHTAQMIAEAIDPINGKFHKRSDIEFPRLFWICGITGPAFFAFIGKKCRLLGLFRTYSQGNFICCHG
jgi:hypothetical protein